MKAEKKREWIIGYAFQKVDGSRDYGYGSANITRVGRLNLNELVETIRKEMGYERVAILMIYENK